MIWYLSIKILIDILILYLFISSFRLPGGFLARSPVVPKLRRSWRPSTRSSHTFPSRMDFGLNASGMPCAFSGWTPRKKRTDMAAIFGADRADRLGWPLEFSSRKLASPWMCLFAFCDFLFRSAIRSASTWQILGGPSTLRKGRFTISSRTQGLGLRSFTMFPACFWESMWLCCCFSQFSDFNDVHHFLKKQCLLQTAAPRHHTGWIDQAFRESSGQSDDSTRPNFMCPCLLLDSDSLVQFCAGSGWLFEATWQGRQRCLVQGRIARSDARRGVICGVPLAWTELIDFRKELGRNSAGTRQELGRSVDFSGAPGFLQLASRKRVPGTPGGSCAEATWNLQISQANKLKKNMFHLLFFFMFRPLPKFKLLNLLHFHLYTCKTTRFLVFAVVQWIVFTSLRDLGFTMVFLTLPMYNLQSHIDSLACVARQVSQRCRATATWMQTATW